jgi:hypothetical protein
VRELVGGKRNSKVGAFGNVYLDYSWNVSSWKYFDGGWWDEIEIWEWKMKGSWNELLSSVVWGFG